MAFIDESDDISVIAEATCCGDNFHGLILALGVFLFLIFLVAAPFQYWIYKRPDSLLAKIFKWSLYVLGTLLLIFSAGLMYELDDEPLRKGIFIALFYGFIFSSTFLLTQHLSRSKKNFKSFLVKILVALLVMQILVQIEMRAQFLSDFLYF